MTDRQSRRAILASVGATVALAGCLGEDTPTDDEENGGDGPDDGGEDPETAENLEWQEATLEDVTTGKSFTIDDSDQPVVVHTFASYCPTCHSQQEEIDEVASDHEDVRFVDLAIEGGDDPDSVADHAVDNGYEWTFAMADDDLTSSLVDEFGQEISVHAQSPLVVVCSDGSTQTVEKVASAAQIRTSLEECG